MAKSTTFSNDMLKLIFQGTTITGIAQNAPSPLTSLFVALHTANPTLGTGLQNASEAAYSTYARQLVARTSSGWTVPTAGSVSPVANIVFPAPTASPGPNITHFSVGVALSGATEILYSGALLAPITPTIGSPPTLITTTAITES